MSSEKDKFPNKFDVDMSPIRNFAEQMDSFFNHSFKHMNSFFNVRPFWVDVNETNSDYVVTAELPGYQRDQIEIEILGNRLCIAVEDKNIMKIKDEQQNYFNNRQAYQRMERFVTLPFEIPENETKASFTNGLLKLTIPKKNSKRKYIDIDD